MHHSTMFVNLEEELTSKGCILPIKRGQPDQSTHRTDNGIIIICMQYPTMHDTSLRRLASLQVNFEAFSCKNI